ncbi:hypothetical protein GIB67_037541 [Kingdonia uniflora]|uniref:Uncharacterized protein n=1 Tax=Kingdonia uniflora TaxID=39325 RepID=A0A7J7NBF4_9MAGN|nr:hypothetical protein GIB67_037541 [Kingdonia uniflora]
MGISSVPILLDLCWNLALLIGANREHELANPMVQGTYANKIEKLPKVLIRGFVAMKSVLGPSDGTSSNVNK